LGVAVSAASALSKETGGCDVEAVKQLFEEVKIYHEKTF
jgi:fructose-1-phosphate kinase PfkB-like protein